MDRTEPQVTSTQEWTPASSKRVEGTADTGDLCSAADLCDRIMCDERVRGALAQRTAISRLPLTFEGGSQEAVTRLKDEGEFWKIVPTAQLQQLHRWYAVFGIAPGELKWRNDAGKVLFTEDGYHAPELKAWSTAKHLERCIDSRTWKCEVGNRGQREEVTPGENGWVLWTAASDRPWSIGAWRALRTWWLLKQYAVEDWARYSERHGQGTVIVKAPEKDAGTLAKRRKLVRELKVMGSNGVVVLPPLHEMELLESKARTHETFKAQVSTADTGIAIALLGQNLTTEVHGGSYAAAKIHSTVAANILAEDAEAIEEFIHDQILVPWSVANFGDPKAAPWPNYDTAPPEDTKPRIESWNLLLDTQEKSVALGVPFDFKAAAELVSMPLLEDDIEPPDGDDDDEPEEDSESDSALAYAPTLDHRDCCHSIQNAVARPGEESGQEYADAVAESMQRALALDLEPHLAELVRIVATSKGDYHKAQAQIEAYYRDKVHADGVSKLVKAGLTMVQLGGWAAVRDDAPEVL